MLYLYPCMMTFVCSGDDAVGVKWSDMDHSLQLYASHADFVRTVARQHGAHW